MKLVMGASGFVGGAIKRVTPEKMLFFSRKEYDLLHSQECPKGDGIETIIYCADYYPGLHYTAGNPYDVYMKNVIMYNNLFRFAAENKVKKIITLGTTACYPVTDDPLQEEMFAQSYPEMTHPKMRGYALSRFTLLDIARVFYEQYGILHSHLILPNLYGPGDKFESGKSHLLSSWIRDFSVAKKKREGITLWGSPYAQREFMYIDDAAQSILALSSLSPHREILNVGNETRPTYGELAHEILRAIGYPVVPQWDKTKTNIRLREILDLRELEKYKRFLPSPTPLALGIEKTVAYYNEVYG